MVSRGGDAEALVRSGASSLDEWPPKHSLFFQDKRRKRLWLAVTAVLLPILLIGVYAAVGNNYTFKTDHGWRRFAFLTLGLVVALAPTLYWWRVAMAFDVWIAAENMSPRRKEFEKDRFKTNNEYARAFWGALIILFAAHLLGS